ncbi:hypothetical protein BCR37DRAFT_393742 [Protomyces lactucae-debilis]|uniref:Uncharacterized protein n=1 Tax=Protomyces lactucae-debilis TaxID=2754530 RepID=A0A1Y2F8Y3_PROLT|nr:uncharacterized protein BCR37DRAFT_393742 [Protomyces lactucae-debilis]ORY80378.1 hypothetical protein BCR37DRAFT_393742 [Protomyces lactucae-debilis]
MLLCREPSSGHARLGDQESSVVTPAYLSTLTMFAVVSRFINLQMMLFLLLSHLVAHVLPGCFSSKCEDHERPSHKSSDTTFSSRRVELILYKAVPAGGQEVCEQKCREEFMDRYMFGLGVDAEIVATHCNLGWVSFSLREPVAVMDLRFDTDAFNQLWPMFKKGKMPADKFQASSSTGNEDDCPDSLLNRVMESVLPIGMTAAMAYARPGHSTTSTVSMSVAGITASAAADAYKKKCAKKKKPKTQKVCLCHVGAVVEELLVPRPGFEEDDNECEPETFVDRFTRQQWTILEKDNRKASAGAPVVYNQNRPRPTYEQYVRSQPASIVRGEYRFTFLAAKYWSWRTRRPLPNAITAQTMHTIGTTCTTIIMDAQGIAQVEETTVEVGDWPVEIT